jgi:hypothetical protein
MRLQEPGSYVGEVVKVMGKNKVLVKVRKLFTEGHNRIRDCQMRPFLALIIWKILTAVLLG